MSKNTKMKVTAEAKEGRGYIRITDFIGQYSDTGCAAAVRRAVDSFLREGIREVTVYVSCKGGDVFEGNDIENELDRMESVELALGAICASAATKWIAKYYTTALPSTKIMIHKPMLTAYGNVDKIEGDLKLLKDITDDYRRSYAAKMAITEEEVNAMWEKGDLWLTADEAFEKKLVDAIDKPRNTPQAVHDVMITAIATEIPETETPKETKDTNNLKMDRVKMIAALGLAADATDEQILAAATSAKAASDELDTVKQSEEANKATKAKELVAQAVKDKKIDAKLVATYEALATANYEGTKAAIDAMTAIPQLSAALAGSVEAKLEARKDWTHDDWMEKDPEGLEMMASTDPDRFKAILNA